MAGNALLPVLLVMTESGERVLSLVFNTNQFMNISVQSEVWQHEEPVVRVLLHF